MWLKKKSQIKVEANIQNAQEHTKLNQLLLLVLGGVKGEISVVIL